MPKHSAYSSLPVPPRLPLVCGHSTNTGRTTSCTLARPMPDQTPKSRSTAPPQAPPPEQTKDVAGSVPVPAPPSSPPSSPLPPSTTSAPQPPVPVPAPAPASAPTVSAPLPAPPALPAIAQPPAAGQSQIASPSPTRLQDGRALAVAGPSRTTAQPSGLPAVSTILIPSRSLATFQAQSADRSNIVPGVSPSLLPSVFPLPSGNSTTFSSDSSSQSSSANYARIAGGVAAGVAFCAIFFVALKIVLTTRRSRSSLDRDVNLADVFHSNGSLQPRRDGGGAYEKGPRPVSNARGLPGYGNMGSFDRHPTFTDHALFSREPHASDLGRSTPLQAPSLPPLPSPVVLQPLHMYSATPQTPTTAMSFFPASPVMPPTMVYAQHGAPLPFSAVVPPPSPHVQHVPAYAAAQLGSSTPDRGYGHEQHGHNFVGYGSGVSSSEYGYEYGYDVRHVRSLARPSSASTGFPETPASAAGLYSQSNAGLNDAPSYPTPVAAVMAVDVAAAQVVQAASRDVLAKSSTAINQPVDGRQDRHGMAHQQRDPFGRPPLPSAHVSKKAQPVSHSATADWVFGSPDAKADRSIQADASFDAGQTEAPKTFDRLGNVTMRHASLYSVAEYKLAGKHGSCRLDADQAFIAAQQDSNVKLMIAVAFYNPTKDDELQVSRGDKIDVHHTYPDGKLGDV
ncbi:hypothetical protein BC831DRAFT_58539 [Entophlyctis helioformis]|nr:hypothetical protein BC831DRAFT_58539 [Entophlyctis helioformis]